MLKKDLIVPGKRAGLLLLPLLFWLIPTSSVEHGPTLCLYTLITGKHCIGCGMLRALSCLIHGNLTRSWDYNHLVIIVAPLLAYVWITELMKTWHLSPFLLLPTSANTIWRRVPFLHH
ncbi:MAG TPA: DUF2752 domain-containing protein [Ktedonobacteraceae bacterium]